MKAPRHRRLVKGPQVMRMDYGQSLPTSGGFDLKLVYVEDSIPIFRAKPAGRRAEAWTESEDHPGYYYRICRWPRRMKEKEPFNKLLSKAISTQHIMDGAIGLLKSGSFSFQEGRA